MLWRHGPNFRDIMVYVGYQVFSWDPNVVHVIDKMAKWLQLYNITLYKVIGSIFKQTKWIVSLVHQFKTVLSSGWVSRTCLIGRFVFPALSYTFKMKHTLYSTSTSTSVPKLCNKTMKGPSWSWTQYMPWTRGDN